MKSTDSGFGYLSSYHFFTLQEDPVRVRKIKLQRDTESCYFSLSPTLCPLRFSGAVTPPGVGVVLR